MAAVKQALQQYPQLDGSRMGFWGWSYGGYFTLYTLEKTDLFKAGVSVAPVTDWRNYDSIYTERYMGLPSDNESGYRKSSPVNFAADLHGSLLEVHGTSDDNVHLQNTIQMVERLHQRRQAIPVDAVSSQDARHRRKGGTDRLVPPDRGPLRKEPRAGEVGEIETQHNGRRMKLKLAKLRLSCLLALLACRAAFAQQAAPAPSRTIIRAGQLLDVRTGKTLTNQAIVIEDGKIVSVGADSGAADASATVIDLSGKTVLPGLIDAHTHITFDPKFGYDRLAISLPREALIGAKNARITLLAGFTTIRNVGADRVRRHRSARRHQCR